MNTIYSILLIFALAAFAHATDYCTAINSCSNHTMCVFPEDDPSPNCGNVLDRRLTSSEKNAILTRHNDLRVRVAAGLERRGVPGPQPPASNLGPLEWDDELEEIAQRWADQCKLHKDQCRDVERFPVNQLFTGRTALVYSGEYPLESIVYSWYDKVRFFNSTEVPAVRNLWDVDSYTQLVWAATTKLGCGKIVYEDVKDGIQFVRINLVCNYGPAGNIIGAPVYQISTPD